MNGYGHGLYARSLEEIGEPHHLSRCGGWILERKIPDTDHWDGMGCYPIFCCQNWDAILDDLDELSLVSLVLVADPFGDYTPEMLKSQFDMVKQFKYHCVADLSRPLESFVSSHHQRYTHKALRDVRVRVTSRPPAEDWVRLYSHLIERHHITGMTAFSAETLTGQLSVPGLVAFTGLLGLEVVSMLLWYAQGKVAYYHLGASSPLGYDLHASYALFWEALKYFAAEGLEWACLGSGPGVNPGSVDRLAGFKAGWATGTRPGYLCGSVLNREIYDYLTPYFPAYRQGEFG